MSRCPWAEGHPLLGDYHDTEWGVPVHDEHRLFEFLVLEGAQAGLSWLTVLRKRERYRERFHGFDPARVSRFGECDIAALLGDPGIIRNRRKLQSAVDNAQAYLGVQEAFGSFDRYLWSFVGGQPIQNAWRTPEAVPAHSPESHRLSRELVRRGFRFVGPTICYALMQAVGLVNDHLVSCPRHAELGGSASRP